MSGPNLPAIREPHAAAREEDRRRQRLEDAIARRAGITGYIPPESLEEYDPTAPFCPVGLVWSGIRIDEFDRLGYHVTEDTTLETGWVRPADRDPSSFAVWSLADWARLIEISRRYHEMRQRLPKPDRVALEEQMAATPTLAVLELLAGRAIERGD